MEQELTAATLWKTGKKCFSSSCHSQGHRNAEPGQLLGGQWNLCCGLPKTQTILTSIHILLWILTALGIF